MHGEDGSLAHTVRRPEFALFKERPKSFLSNLNKTKKTLFRTKLNTSRLETATSLCPFFGERSLWQTFPEREISEKGVLGVAICAVFPRDCDRVPNRSTLHLCFSTLLAESDRWTVFENSIRTALHTGFNFQKWLLHGLVSTIQQEPTKNGILNGRVSREWCTLCVTRARAGTLQTFGGCCELAL